MSYITACYRCLTPVATSAIKTETVYCKQCISMWNYVHNFEGYLAGNVINPNQNITGKKVHN